jgi:hypothetical protein
VFLGSLLPTALPVRLGWSPPNAAFFAHGAEDLQLVSAWAVNWDQLRSLPTSRLIRTKPFQGRSLTQPGTTMCLMYLQREEIFVSLHVVKRVSSFHRASSDLKEMEIAIPS